MGFVDVVGCLVESKSAPGFCDDDAVAGVAGVEADLDGQVDADVADIVWQEGDVLGALVGNAADAIAVHEDAGGGGRGVGGYVCDPLGFGDAAIGDATDPCDVVAAGTLYLGCAGLAAGEEVGSDAGDSCCAEGDDNDVPRVTEQNRRLGWNVREHGGLEMRIAHWRGWREKEEGEYRGMFPA